MPEGVNMHLLWWCEQSMRDTEKRGTPSHTKKEDTDEEASLDPSPHTRVFFLL